MQAYCGRNVQGELKETKSQTGSHVESERDRNDLKVKTATTRTGQRTNRRLIAQGHTVWMMGINIVDSVIGRLPVCTKRRWSMLLWDLWCPERTNGGTGKQRQKENLIWFLHVCSYKDMVLTMTSSSSRGRDKWLSAIHRWCWGDGSVDKAFAFKRVSQ